MPPTVCRERGIHRSSERRALFPTGLTIQALATFLFHRIPAYESVRQPDDHNREANRPLLPSRR